MWTINGDNSDADLWNKFREEVQFKKCVAAKPMAMEVDVKMMVETELLSHAAKKILWWTCNKKCVLGHAADMWYEYQDGHLCQ